MAKIFRISGYLVSKEEKSDKDGIEDYMNSPMNRYGFLNWDEMWQQLHVEESERFELDGEDKENCDLALITRHFKKGVDYNFDRPIPQAGEKYKHFKVGKIVDIVGLSRHTETEEVTVVYEYNGQIWNRPLEMFMSEVDREKYKNVSQKYRFEKVKSEG